MQFRESPLWMRRRVVTCTYYISSGVCGLADKTARAAGWLRTERRQGNPKNCAVSEGTRNFQGPLPLARLFPVPGYADGAAPYFCAYSAGPAPLRHRRA